MHANNFTLYQLVKYHIELTEAMEYTLITYKYDENELKERIEFLKDDYKKGFYHEITNKLFYKPKKLTKEIKLFTKKYTQKKVKALTTTHNLHSRVEYNTTLYSAFVSSNKILQAFLKEEEIKTHVEESLLKLIETTNSHFLLFALFNTLNLYVASKVVLMSNDSLYTLDQIDKETLLKLIDNIKDSIDQKSLIEDTLSLIKEEKEFNEEDAYELLNKVSVECIKSEKDLYTDFEAFTSQLEKEIEKGHK